MSHIIQCFTAPPLQTAVSVITIKRFACKPLVTQIQKIDFVYSCFAKLTENWFLGHHTDRSQCKNKFESKILFHHGEISFWRQNFEKYYRYSWKNTQKLRTTQQTIRSTMSYIKDFLTKWPIKIASKNREFIVSEKIPTQIRIYWCLDLKKNQTAIQNLDFHFWGFGVNFFMMVITLTGGYR